MPEPAIPAPVADLCATFLTAVPKGLVTGLYLRGGVGFGEWIEGHSDVDFFATLDHRPSPAEVEALRAAHRVVAARSGGSPSFDGAHVLAADLAADPRDCPDVPTVLVGTFHEAGRHEISPVAWHELARHGVTVAGPHLADLDVWTDDAVLREFTLDNLDTYWRAQAAGCALNPAAAATDAACEWVVPGVTRLHHLLVTGDQTTKSRAVHWALSCYPERWHPVLRESLHLREGAFGSQYADPDDRGADVTAFASYVVEVGSALR